MVQRVSSFLIVSIFLIGSSASPRTIRVAQDGTGDFTSVSAVFEAVQAAQAGDTVQVAEGHYDASGIVLDKPLVLLGAGADKTVLSSNIGSVFAVKVEMCVIEGFTLGADNWAFGGSFPGEVVDIVCVDASPIIRHNTFWGGVGNGVYNVMCSGQAAPVIEKNNFQVLGGSYGVYLKDNPREVQAEQNWWGTTDEKKIQEGIWDGHDQPGLGLVSYAPWRSEPWREGTTGVLPVTFGQLKAWFLHEVR